MTYDTPRKAGSGRDYDLSTFQLLRCSFHQSSQSLASWQETLAMSRSSLGVLPLVLQKRPPGPHYSRFQRPVALLVRRP